MYGKKIVAYFAVIVSNYLRQKWRKPLSSSRMFLSRHSGVCYADPQCSSAFQTPIAKSINFTLSHSGYGHITKPWIYKKLFAINFADQMVRAHLASYIKPNLSYIMIVTTFRWTSHLLQWHIPQSRQYYTRWFKYDRDWFVCKQAALRSSCATLREWSHNLHPPSCSG